jgi:hypothetical protein
LLEGRTRVQAPEEMGEMFGKLIISQPVTPWQCVPPVRG